MDLPEDSLFTECDYEKMREVLSQQSSIELLEELSDVEQIACSSVEGGAELQRLALIKCVRGPSIVPSYCLTSMGELVIENDFDVDATIEAFIKAESQFQQKYSA